MADTDIIVSEMTPASQINTDDLMIMTQPDEQAETGYTTKRGTVLQVANKMLKGTEYSTDLPDFTDKTPLGGLEELKADIKALLPIGSASGNPCNFETGITDKLVSLKAAIVASGGYDADTQTSHPIVGHSELNLVRCGKNLFDVTLTSQTVNDVVFTVNSDKTITANGTADGNIFLQVGTIHVIAGQTYTLTGCPSGGGSGVYSLYASLTDGNKNDYGSGVTFTATITEDAPVRIAVYNTKTVNGTYKPQIVLGSTPSAYAPYNGTPYLVSFGQTVYGGEYTADGKVKKTWESEFDSLTFTYANGFFKTSSIANKVKKPETQSTVVNALCDIFKAVNWNDCGDNDNEFAVSKDNGELIIKCSSVSTVPDFMALISGHTFTYELATPIEINVSSISVEAVSGVNNIVSDCGGDVEVKYREGIQHYIDKKIAETQALIL